MKKGNCFCDWLTDYLTYEASDNTLDAQILVGNGQ